jgi:hypothetical protein
VRSETVGYRRQAVWPAQDELVDLIGKPRRAIIPTPADQQTPDRTWYPLSQRDAVSLREVHPERTLTTRPRRTPKV